MTRQLIQQIFDRIEERMPEVKQRGVFNNTFQRIAEGNENGIQLPAIYVSFPEGVEYTQNGSGAQRSNDFIVRLNLAVRVLDDKKILDIFDLKETVFEVFHKWQPVNSSSFERIAESPDELHENVYIFKTDFKTNLISTSRFVNNDRIQVNVSGDISAKYIDKI